VRGQLRQLVAAEIRRNPGWLDAPALEVVAQRVRAEGALGVQHCEIVRAELHGVIADQKAAPARPDALHAREPKWWDDVYYEGNTTVWTYDSDETSDDDEAWNRSQVCHVAERDDMAGGIATNLLASHADDPMAWLTRRQTMLMARFPHAQNEVTAMCQIVRTALEADLAAGTRWEDR
jgi:hypothetical protein